MYNILLLAFLIKPSNARVVLGDNARFYCQFPGMDVSIEWKINNVSLSEYTDVNINDQIRQNTSGSVHTLTILALKSYNETTVKCSARLLPHLSNCQQEVESESDTVILLIQGTITCSAYQNSSHFLQLHVHAYITICNIIINAKPPTQAWDIEILPILRA
jgi:hypothetical protein